MKVQEIKLSDNRIRYLVIDDNWMPIEPVTKYLKHLDNIGKRFNTLKTYAYALKSYFEYLKEINKEYNDITFDILSNFVGWLRNPYANNVTSIKPVQSKRKEKTINLIITVVIGFYDYLYRIEDIQENIYQKTMKKVFIRNKTSYKNFLYHVTKNKPKEKNILKLKEPRTKLKILSKDEMIQVYNATNNIRDQFLIKLLFETGFRIGEALSLQHNDIIYDHCNGHRIKLVNRGELNNKACLKSGERQVFVSQELLDLYDDYAYDVLDELNIDTNFVFVKLKGKNKGQPLTYQNVSDLFKMIKKKTGLDVYAHLIRHTHATIFYQKTKDIKLLQERIGHSSIQTTMNIYLHPTDEEIRANWEDASFSFKLEKGEKTNE